MIIVMTLSLYDDKSETKTSDGDDSDDNGDDGSDDGDENFLQDSLASSAVLLAPQVLFTKIYFCLTGVLDFFFSQKKYSYHGPH